MLDRPSPHSGASIAAALFVACAAAISPAIAFASGLGALGFYVMILPPIVAFGLGHLGVGLLVARKTERLAFVGVYFACLFAAGLALKFLPTSIAVTIALLPVPFALWDRGSKIGALIGLASMWGAGWLYARVALVALSSAWHLLYWPVLLAPLVPLAVALAISGHRRSALALLPSFAVATVAWTVYAIR